MRGVQGLRFGVRHQDRVTLAKDDQEECFQIVFQVLCVLRKYTLTHSSKNFLVEMGWWIQIVADGHWGTTGCVWRRLERSVGHSKKQRFSVGEGEVLPA